MDENQQTRAANAISEGMEIEPVDGSVFEVKGKYEVDIDAKTCECADYEYRNMTCKHLVRVQLELLWDNIQRADGDDGEATGKPSRPVPLVPDYEMVPVELREMDQWVCWEHQYVPEESRENDWTKVPIDVDGGFASSTNPETWTSFEEAKDYDTSTYDRTDGIGIVVSEHDDLIGIDIDDCRDPDSGFLDEAVQLLLADVDTYAEASPSGTGIRIFAFGEKTSSACEADLPGDAHIEMYDDGRYLTVTGHHINRTPESVTYDSETVAEFDRRMDE